MIVKADERQRAAWALQEVSSGYIHLAEICEDEASAYALVREMRRLQPHRGGWRVVPVLVVLVSPGRAA